ncbi:uncharacterized protein LOC125682058 isoform X3 [Ostrea edulis]|uniref:uncharacterized protein LOC125682058 isoform X3 n=1 Tax=Ostrea edulis TaxID=37623 RepID=UPI0024AFC2E4|nr:uncharacterized protein LOC125682058 isoform X3 [Ostrea edulis]
MNRFGGNLGQGLLGNPPVSSNFSPHDQNMFLGGDGSFGGNQESYIGDGGGYARDLGDSGGRMGGGKDGGYFQDTDIRGNSFREQMNGSDRYGGRDLNRKDRRVSGDHDYRNEEDFYSGTNTLPGGRQDRLSGGGNFGDGRGREVTQDHFSRLGVGNVNPSVMNKGQGILGSGPIVGGDTDFRNQGGYGGLGNHSRSGNVQSVGNLGFSPQKLGNQSIRQQGGGPGLQMAGMEANLLTLQKQQQQQEAMLRDTQLQMVNSLLLQQQQNKRGTGNQLNPGFGGPGLLGTPQNLSSGLMRSPGSNQRGTGHIPSLLDINTQKPQGKRGFSGPRDQGGFKRQRMAAQKRTPDRRYDNNSNRSQRRHSPDRQRSSEGKDSRSSTPRRKESDGARNTPARGPSTAQPQHTNVAKQSTSEMKQHSTETIPQITPKAKPMQADLTEKYDPEEPTEDEIMDLEEERETIRVLDIAEEPNPSCIIEEVENIEDVTVVTVEKESEENDEKSKERVDSTKKVTNFFCHVCNTECRDPEGFAKHMNGMKHKNRMESMMGLHLEKSNQLISRIKAEEHLRKIESSPRDEDRRKSDGDRRRSRDGGDRQSGNNFQRHFSGPFRRRGAFHQSDSRSRRDRRRSTDQEIFPDIGDLVTVDTVGFEDDTDRDITGSKSPLKTKPVEKPVSEQTSKDMEIILVDDASDDEKKVSKRKKLKTPLVSTESKKSLEADVEGKKSVNGNSSKTDEPAEAKESSISTPSKPSDEEENPKNMTDTAPVEMTSTPGIKETKDASIGKEAAKEASSITPPENLADLPQKPLKTPSTQAKKESPAPKAMDTLTEGIPPYNPDLPIGQNYIVAVTGFYCKLCSKFYNNEKAAREAHCQSRSHYDKFKDYYQLLCNCLNCRETLI